MKILVVDDSSTMRRIITNCLKGLGDHEIHEAGDGAEGALLWAVSTKGQKLAKYNLDSVPTWDGMAAAYGRLYIATTDGEIQCFGR